MSIANMLPLCRRRRGERRSSRGEPAKAAIDAIVEGALHGWAWDRRSDTPLQIDLLYNDEVIAQAVEASAMRDDLCAVGHSTGKAGFCIPIPPAYELSSGRLTVRATTTSEHLATFLAESIPRRAFVADFGHVASTRIKEPGLSDAGNRSDSSHASISATGSNGKSILKRGFSSKPDDATDASCSHATQRLTSQMIAQFRRSFARSANQAPVERAELSPSSHAHAITTHDGTSLDLFDAEYYLKCNTDVASAKIDPLQHFINFGIRERRAFSPLVDEDYVNLQAGANRSAIELISATRDLSLRPHRLFCPGEVASALGMGADVTVAEVLIAYLTRTDAWSIAPHPLFDPSRFGNVNRPPLVAYLTDPSLWSIAPHDLFDPVHYATQVGSLEKAPLAHYVEVGLRQNFSPHPLFDTRYYALQAAPCWREEISALEHFVRDGSLDPSPQFHWRYYFADHPEDVFKAPKWKVFAEAAAGAGHRTYASPSVGLDAEAHRIIVQMTSPRPRNPYYVQMRDAFRLAGWDFRNSVDVPAMLDYARAKGSSLLVWFHQLEPFYHTESASRTRRRKDRLVAHLRAMREAGGQVIHTWHNAEPYDAAHIDIDYELYFEVGDIFDLVVTHVNTALPWIKRFCPRVPVAVLPHPSVDRTIHPAIDRSIARSRLRLPENAFVFASFGEIKPYKAIGLLLDAWKRRDVATGAVLLIAGKWRYETEDLARAMAMEDVVVVNKLLSDEEVATVVAAADVCVFTHDRIWMSGTAMTAINLGRPVIVPGGTGLEEIVQDDDNGLIFESGNAASLLGTMERIQKTTLIKHMAFMNRSLAEEHHPVRLQPQYAKVLKSIG